MVLIPRHPNVQDVLCRHDELSGTAEAGAIVFLSGDQKVAKVAASGNVPHGMLAQRVNAQPAGLPQNFKFPGQLGTCDAQLGDPVLVFHGGIFETTHYSLPAGVAAGAPLFAQAGVPAHNSKLVAVSAGCALGHDGSPKIVAVAQNTLSADQAAAGERLVIKLEV